MRDYDIDLIHSHNAPDFLTESTIKSAGSIPIIHDNHDVLSLRKTRYGIASVDPKDGETIETERDCWEEENEWDEFLLEEEEWT